MRANMRPLLAGDLDVVNVLRQGPAFTRPVSLTTQPDREARSWHSSSCENSRPRNQVQRYLDAGFSSTPTATLAGPSQDRIPACWPYTRAHHLANNLGRQTGRLSLENKEPRLNERASTQFHSARFLSARISLGKDFS